MALLAYLAMRADEPVSRDHLAGLLWSDSSSEQARANLRQALSQLRHVFRDTGLNPIEATADKIVLRSEGLSIDVHRSTHARSASAPDARQCDDREFLEGFSITEPEFERWLAAQRESLRSRARNLHETLAEEAYRDRRIDEAIDHLTSALRLDPLHEHVHRRLMELFAAQGRTDAAIAQFDRCRLILRQELDIAPDKKTTALYHTIRRQRTAGGGEPADKTASNSDAQTPSVEPPTTKSDKPSIAVLPFENMSRDPDRQFIADAIAEDIVTALSKNPELYVIARNSTFVYKDRAVSVQQVGRELGVRYVLEGSVRQVGTRLRVTAQLIDAQDNRHVWAERYDREVDDVFAVQDDITRNVATALQVKLTWGETSRLWQGGTRSFEAWQCMARAFEHWYRFDAVENAEARRLCERAVEIDPEHGTAWALLAWTYWFEARFLHAPNPDALLERFEVLVNKVVALGNAPAPAHHLTGTLHMIRGELKEAIAALRRAVELAPSNAEMHGLLGIALTFAGNPAEGLASAETAFRLSPRPPEFVLWALVEGLRWTGALDEALAVAQRCVAEAPNSYLAQVKLTSILFDLRREDEATEAARRVLALDPKFSIEVYGRTQNYTDSGRLARVLSGLCKAGLPQ
ncbi:MAG: tetratricopeptide repeat protein [Myxococcota bacterium]